MSLAAAILAGYASSLITAGRCELDAANTVARELGTRAVFVLAPDASWPSARYVGSESILRRAGFTVRRCETSGTEFNCFPWAGVARAEVRYPFLVNVRWGFVGAPTSGRGTRSRYAALFGLVIHVADFGGWVT